MPPFDRGVYEPDEEVRVFDGSDEDEDVEGSRLPLLILLALLVLAMFGGVVWLAYNEGVTRGRTETPVVTAANGPARVAPANPGGAEQPFKGFKIYEQPAPPDDDVGAPATNAASNATPEKPTASPAVTEKTSPPPATKPAITAAAPPAAPPASKPVAMAPAPAAKPVPAPAAKPAPPAKAAAVIVGPATAPPRSLAATPPAAPAAKPAAAPVAPAAKPPAAPATQVAATGSVVLQIGAYKSQADADTAWKTYRGKHAALLDGYNSDVQQADLGDKGTWYRLRIAGFASKDVASALCDRLKADGGACFLGK